MDTMSFENVLSPEEMSLIKGGRWVLTDEGWKWLEDNNSLDDDDWNL